MEKFLKNYLEKNRHKLYCVDIDRYDIIGTDIEILYEGYDWRTCFRVACLDKFPLADLKLLPEICPR